jgi:hypothetical protein
MGQQTTLVMASIVVPSLLLRSLLLVASQAVQVSIDHNKELMAKDIVNLEWATSFVYVFTAMSIFLGLAFSHSDGSAGRHQKSLGYDQPHLTNV